MKQLLLLAILLPVLAYGQQDDWEFVPLTGGHISFFVPNPFNENDLFAVAESPHVFYSSDRGRNWLNISSNLRDLIGGGYKLYDLAVTENGWIFLTGCRYSCLIRSTNWGETWERFEVTGADTLSSHNTIFSTKVGRLWVHNLNYRLIKYSDDYGITWNILDTPFSEDWRFQVLNSGFAITSTNMTIFAFGPRGFFQYSKDSSSPWKSDSTFQTYDQIYRLFTYDIDSLLVHGIWARHYTASNKPKWIDYFESVDSGRTWTLHNDNNIPWDNVYAHDLNSRPHTVVYPNGTILSTHNNILYRSFDRGSSWEVDFDKPPMYDLYLFNDTLFTSMPMVGIVRSTDTGRTWFAVESLGDMALFETIRLQVAGGYLCALVNDAGGPMNYMISSDGGEHWTKVFETENNLLDFAITMEPEPRYTILYKNYVLGGTLWQAAPDTVLTALYSFTFPGGNIYTWLATTRAQPGLIYFVARDGSGSWLYRSSNGGKTWLRHEAPPYVYDYFLLLPSQKYPDRLVAISSPWNSIDLAGMGIWYIRDYGRNWELTLNRVPLPGGNYRIFENDLLFNTGEYRKSYDYGRTWEPFDDGLINGNNLIGMTPHLTDAAMFLTYEYVWYYYNGTRWELFDQFNDESKVWRYLPQSLWYDNNTLWGAFRGHGIYKLRNPVITGIYEPSPVPASAELIVYPNPFASVAEISYRIPEAQSVRLVVLNSLGEQVAVLEEGYKQRGEYTAAFNGVSLPSGVYYYRLSAGDATITKSMVLVK